MRNNRARIEVLRRVIRVRTIEHRLAMYRLAEARREQARMRKLAERSDALALSPATTRASGDGKSLANSLAFGAQARGLTASAHDLLQNAGRTAEVASGELGAIGRKRDRIMQLATAQQAQLKAKELGRDAAKAGQLARRLQYIAGIKSPPSRKDHT